MADIEKMKFAAHQSFYIREGWLYKGLHEIKENPKAFLDDLAQDRFGIGANMVVALRYWLQAVGLTEEACEQGSRKRIQKLTSFGNLVSDKDPHVETDGSLCFLQYNLASNKEMATSWYYFFNEFNVQEFTKEDLTDFIMNKIASAIQKSEKSIERDVDCIIKTYLQDEDDRNYEDNKRSPFQSLHLIERVEGKRGVYRKVPCDIERIHPLVAYAMMQNMKDKAKSQLTFRECLEESKSIGKVFNLDFSAFLGLLQKMQKASYISVERTAGMDVINMNKSSAPKNALEDYYILMNQEETTCNLTK